MKHMSLVVSATILSAGCSCTTLWGGKSAQPAKSQNSIQTISSSAARVQGSWQSRFEFAVQEAGSQAEGWALFADSPMGHTGQQMVIRFADGSLKLCYASQAVNDCSYQPLDLARWQKLAAVTAAADGLSDRPLQTFDTQNLEYVHHKNIDGKLTTVARVFFMIDHRPLPSDYDQLVDGFIGLNK